MIVTFTSHYGAMRFKKEMEKRGAAVTLMPVPRRFSSSCGTCARLDWPDRNTLYTADVEEVYEE